jgi:aminopeptidase N
LLNYFLLLDAVTDVKDGQPLRDYGGLQPESNKLEASIERVSSLGQPLTMRCSSKKKISSCTWKSPQMDIQKADQPNTEVIAHEQTCLFNIKSLEQEQLGRWTCQVTLEGVDQYQEAYVTATSDVPVKDVRLPGHAIPEDYIIHLTPFIIVDNFTIEGHVSINIDVNADADNITLHINGIEIYENMVQLFDGTNAAAANAVPVLGHGYDKDREYYVVKADVSGGHKYRLSIAFRGDLNDDLAGLYRSSYLDSVANETRWIATSQMEATDARRALPCFDEPAFKAKFQINLGRLRRMTSISNMPIMEASVAMADNDEYVWDAFQQSLKMSTYLLAFVVSDFAYLKSAPTSNGVEFRIWSRQEAKDQTGYASIIGPKILQYYEEYFSVPFPLPKQDMIALPDFSAGAMENWGLITYRETALLYEEGVSSKSSREYVATVVAHELAHQWFGDLVTMEWWDE